MGYQYIPAFCNVLKDFCKTTSSTGFRYLVDPKRTWLERFLWWILQIFLFISMLVMIVNQWNNFFENPLITSLESSNYDISNVPFPAVSICNINKMSRKRSAQFADVLAEKANIPFYFLDQINVLGRLYNYYDDSQFDLLAVQSFLERYMSMDNNNLHSLMRNLSTPCEELLFKCKWKDEDKDCSEIFTLRPTFEGFCCIFNYLRPNPFNSSFKPPKEGKRVDEAGWHNGLTVIVRNDPDDYFYPTLSSIGVNVHIFDPSDFPDATSGGLNEHLVALGTETFLNLEPSTVYSVSNVRDYPIRIRECIFDDEVSTVFGRYSFSNCLMECRVKSILALCQCIPLIMPSHNNVTTCILPDIPCLNKYQDKWHSLYPRDFESDELEHEKQNSLNCPECYSSCSDTTYKVTTNFAPLNIRGLAKEKYENFSVIRIYFGKDHSNLYKQDVVYYWFELLSNFGGLMGIFLGMSCLSIIEFLYFITFRFIATLKKFKI